VALSQACIVEMACADVYTNAISTCQNYTDNCKSFIKNMAPQVLKSNRMNLGNHMQLLQPVSIFQVSSKLVLIIQARAKPWHILLALSCIHKRSLTGQWLKQACCC